MQDMARTGGQRGLLEQISEQGHRWRCEVTLDEVHSSTSENVRDGAGQILNCAA